jgi:hypothetical protein
VQDLHLKPTGAQGARMHCSIVRSCGRIFGEVGDALDIALQRNGCSLYHPDCMRDYVPAEVVANVIGHAVAAAAGGGGGNMTTYDVSLDEPVSQLTFYRMVQTVANNARASRPPVLAASESDAAAFKIEFGRSALGRVCAALYMIGVALGAKVSVRAAVFLGASLTAAPGVGRSSGGGRVQQQRALQQLRPFFLLLALNAAFGVQAAAAGAVRATRCVAAAAP